MQTPMTQPHAGTISGGYMLGVLPLVASKGCRKLPVEPQPPRA